MSGWWVLFIDDGLFINGSSICCWTSRGRSKLNRLLTGCKDEMEEEEEEIGCFVEVQFYCAWRCRLFSQLIQFNILFGSLILLPQPAAAWTRIRKSFFEYQSVNIFLSLSNSSSQQLMLEMGKCVSVYKVYDYW